MAAWVELSGHRPAYPRDDEHLLGAIGRVEPELILLDCEHQSAHEDDSFRLAKETGIQVLLFSAMQTQSEVEALAARRGLHAFALPMHYLEISSRIQSAIDA